MKEFIDKLISRFKKVSFADIDEQYADDGQMMLFLHDAISIVNELAEECNNESVKGDLISKSAVIKELNEIYLDNPWDNKEDILEKVIGIVDHIPTVYVPAPYTEGE